jgi:hypothetical protein
MRRTRSELQGGTPLAVVLSRGCFSTGKDNRKASLNSTVDGADVCQTYGRTAMMRSLMGVEEEIEDYRRMAMRYPVRTRSSRRERMGGLTWSPRSNTRPRTSRVCVTL